MAKKRSNIRKQTRTEGGNRTRSMAEYGMLKGAEAVDNAIEKYVPSVANSSAYKKTKKAIKDEYDIRPSYKKGGSIRGLKNGPNHR
jgi:hypothetical protein